MAEEYTNQNAKRALVADSDPAVLQAIEKVGKRAHARSSRSQRSPHHALPALCLVYPAVSGRGDGSGNQVHEARAGSAFPVWYQPP